MVQISATVEHDERMSDELGPVVLHDKIYSLEMLPSVIEWCARGGNGGHGANGGNYGDVAIAQATGATEERPRAVPTMAQTRTGIT
eukprot:scaffold38308_cov34-Attheya_sp.AAC.6